eukprot:CAMPEP_0178751416 /NCGR_PEP_ID=MMETSP0744-20121128/10517_1 /TAXON_ID=913974 /ORGANISM="Nitzschia punctata, Strain CCMP561" /LENGTH=741 /DNA_ID=CAMNT_0020405065 /DNA_START=42 /DNA_END=2269 /DNA_ORIENTATION=+
MHLRGESRKDVFACLLDALLDLMNSEYGFIGHVEYEEDGLRTDAIANIAWNEATHRLYHENVENGLKFSNMATLFGHCLVHKEPVIANQPATDPRAAGIPEGHPALNHFLGIPFFRDEDIYGMIGISNRPGGYSEADLKYLEPFIIAVLFADSVNTLEKKVKERTQRLEQANADLAAANKKVVQHSKAQLQHFACMSHEIRTPLNCILGLSSLLKESSLDAKQQDAVQMMITSGDLLLTVVNDVLDYSKLETGHVDIEMTDSSLQESLNAVIHSIEAKAATAEIILEVNCDTSVPAVLRTDGRRLQQILYNLLGNAIKFSPPGTVELKLSTVEKQDEETSDRMAVETCPQAGGKPVEACPHLARLHEAVDASACSMDTTEEESMRRKFVRFEVIDYGRGIPKEDFERIFQPFVQSGSDTEACYGGTGLGLAITSKLVRALGGTIDVDSAVGVKTKFTVDLPLAADSPVDIQGLKASLQNSSIMLVGAREGTKEWMEQVMKDFDLQLEIYDSLLDTMKSIVQKRSDTLCIALVHESLVNSLRENIREAKIGNVRLLSFGWHYNTPGSDCHFRCLRRFIPVVMLECLVSQIKDTESAYTSGERQCKKPRTNAVQNVDYRVLVAEDNRINQKVLLRLLQQVGIQNVKVVDNGKEAVDVCAQEDFDVILMDKQMPVMNGLDACRLILNGDTNQRKPKIVLATAEVSQGLEQQSREAGCSDFLPKPFSLKDVKTLFHKLSISKEES